MLNGASISVVMPAYNEEPFIAAAVEGFRAIPEVDEVIVVDNNSTDQTRAHAEQAGAKVIVESRQGYGHASKTALLSATGDFVFIVEPDGTFKPDDLHKFFPYCAEMDAVIGTRTAKSCIWEGANMGWFLRLGNVAVAKLLEYLHNGPCLTDVGCTFKMVRRSVLHQIKDHLTVGSSHFSPELMTVLIRCGFRCVEIPLNYCPRQGESKITGDLWKAWKLGWRMIGMIVAMRFKHFPQLASSAAARPETAASQAAETA